MERSLCKCSFLGTFFRRAQEKHFQEGTAEPQISPLRFAPVEMTKGRVVMVRSSGDGEVKLIQW